MTLTLNIDDVPVITLLKALANAGLCLRSSPEGLTLSTMKLTNTEQAYVTWNDAFSEEELLEMDRYLDTPPAPTMPLPITLRRQAE